MGRNGPKEAEAGVAPSRGGAHLVHAAALAAFLAAGIGSAVAQNAGRPITSALLFLLGVTVAGALEGVWGGLIAALAASIAYNLLIIEPTFQFSLATAEDYVPIIAFNVCAVTSGWLTGRLKDRALTAERANRRAAGLLALSEALQGAVNLPDVLAAVRAFIGDGGPFSVELYVVKDGRLDPVGTGGAHGDFAAAAFASARPRSSEGGNQAFLLSTSDAAAGVLVVAAPGDEALLLDEDVAGLTHLLALAVERCLLLTRLAETELVRKSEEFKTTLLSSVSHDLRTPLSAISASATSLASYGSELGEEDKADMLRVIEEQCERLNRYTTNLLSLGRLQGGLPDRLPECDALEVLGAAIAQARGLGSGHSFEKRLDIAEALVRADPVLLEQVFFNVLENSVRYSEPRSMVTVCALARQSKLIVSVRDRGRGIPPHEFSRIFERFYRGGGGERAAEGTGLGLAIARGFTEAAGGRIWAGLPDDEGGGTIVTIELPLAAQPEAGR